MIHGRIQRASQDEGRVTHLVAETLEDRTADLALLAESQMLDPPRARGDEAAGATPGRGEVRPPPESRRHPRDVRVLPKSRDFH